MHFNALKAEESRRHIVAVTAKEYTVIRGAQH